MKPRLILERERDLSELPWLPFFLFLLFMFLICKALELGGVTVGNYRKGRTKYKSGRSHTLKGKQKSSRVQKVTGKI